MSQGAEVDVVRLFPSQRLRGNTEMKKDMNVYSGVSYLSYQVPMKTLLTNCAKR